MSHFFKTELGQTALQQRSIALTARQRRLLLLIDHEDFKGLDQDYKARIAPTELLQQLIDMGLLAQHTAVNTPQISTTLTLQDNEQATPTQSAHMPEKQMALSPLAEPTLEQLPFAEIQQVMIETLTSYCGLMARPLIQNIQTIDSLQQLKACQMQWITSLQESRMPPEQLNQTLKLINYSVQHLSS